MLVSDCLQRSGFTCTAQWADVGPTYAISSVGTLITGDYSHVLQIYRTRKVLCQVEIFFSGEYKRSLFVKTALDPPELKGGEI